MQNKQGILYLISTPIGNLEDISLRALRILKEVDLLAVEDTRRTKKLLSHYGISKHLIKYHSYNRIKSTERIISTLKEGKNIGLVADAGTPGISDPGSYLINTCLLQGIKIVPLPGPTAVVTALIVSGLPTDRFVFEGFLPRKKGKRVGKLTKLESEEKTIIIYETAQRLSLTLKDIYATLGERRIAIVRELTKIYEQVIRGSLSELINQLQGKKLKGEISLVIEGKKE